MNFYLNEKSLNGQFPNNKDFEKAVSVFINLLVKVNNANNFFYISSHLFDQKVIRETKLHSVINLIGKDVARKFKNLLVNAEKTTLNEDLVPDKYIYIIQDNTYSADYLSTICYAAELHIIGDMSKSLFLNFSNSNFGERTEFIVYKNTMDNERIDLFCTDKQEVLIKHLEGSQFFFSPLNNAIPSDNQTILRDKSRFRKTMIFAQGRSVYFEVSRNRYWYVDNFHKGVGSHLEVFDYSGSHLGEANLNGEIDISKKDIRKKININ